MGQDFERPEELEGEFEKAFEEDESAEGASEESASPEEQQPQPQETPSAEEVNTEIEPGQQQEAVPGEGDQEGDGVADAGEEPGLEELEELKKKAHGYESMLGRLKQQQEATKQLQAELEELKRQQQEAAQRTKQPEEPKQAKTVEIDEELREDVEEFIREFPEYKDLIFEDSREGKRLRKQLQDYGPEIAAVVADNIMLRREVAYKEQLRQQQEELKAKERAQAMAQAHFQAIWKEHEDLKELMTNPDKQQELQEFYQKLNTWASAKPFAEAVQIFNVIKQGTATEVIEVLNRFKEETGRQSTAPQQDPDVSNAVRAAMAVKSKPSPLPKTRATKDDFDSAWEEAPD
jgi:hypothetical protein